MIHRIVSPAHRCFPEKNRGTEWGDVNMDTAVGYEVVELDRVERNRALIKQELRAKLQQGHTLIDLLAFGPGQDCEIFKAEKFYPGDVVIYVPDVYLNRIPLNRPITDPEELEEVLSQCYTGRDFIDECSGDVEKAKRLFYYCDWQHPSSAMDELTDDEEENTDNTAPSSTGGDYSPSNPWDTPGMSVSDFI